MRRWRRPVRVEGPGTVELAVAYDHTLVGEDLSLEFVDRPPSPRWSPGDALSYQVLGSGRSGGGEQVSSSFRAHAVVAWPEVSELVGTIGQVGELVHDGLRCEGADCCVEGVGIEHVADDGSGAQ